MKKTAGMLALLAIGTMASYSVMASDWNNYRVTVTNATTNHVITPPLIVIHNRHFKLFEVATSASEGLATQAETGSPAVIANEVNGSRGVYDVITGDALIHPGNNASFDIRAPKNAKISVTGMLATTNDAFTSISSKDLPKRSVSYMGETYDAGSEVNNESCAFIPGPPCEPKSGNARATEGAEGFITIHSGIKGRADLSSANLDWRGATSVISIARIEN